jgi:hypothetical protein
LIYLSEYILQELKENIRLLEKAEHLSSASEKDSNANHINNNDRPLTKKEVSNSALKVGDYPHQCFGICPLMLRV